MTYKLNNREFDLATDLIEYVLSFSKGDGFIPAADFSWVLVRKQNLFTLIQDHLEYGNTIECRMYKYDQGQVKFVRLVRA